MLSCWFVCLGLLQGNLAPGEKYKRTGCRITLLLMEAIRDAYESYSNSSALATPLCVLVQQLQLVNPGYHSRGCCVDESMDSMQRLNWAGAVQGGAPAHKRPGLEFSSRFWQSA